MNKVRLWVNPEFKKKLKKIAADKEITVIDLTREMADHNNGPVEQIKPKKQKGGFKFDIPGF